ncbi:661_t:CDS:1, partial [Funneliformis geosporum]
REKARRENNYLTEAERLEKQSQEYLKEIELAKFHEERGKIKCECYQCEAQKEIQQEVKAKVKEEVRQAEKELDDY